VFDGIGRWARLDEHGGAVFARAKVSGAAPMQQSLNVGGVTRFGGG
jgi:hypothetical protein